MHMVDVFTMLRLNCNYYVELDILRLLSVLRTRPLCQHVDSKNIDIATILSS